MDVLVAIDAVDDLVHRAPEGLFAGRKRIDPAAYQQAMETLRRGIRGDMAEPGRSAALAIVERLEAAGASSRRSSLVRGIGRRRSDIYDVLDELRQFVPRAIIAQRKTGC